MSYRALHSLTWTDGSQRHRADTGDTVDPPVEMVPGMIARGEIEPLTSEVREFDVVDNDDDTVISVPDEDEAEG